MAHLSLMYLMRHKNFLLSPTWVNFNLFICISLFTGVCGVIAVIVFASLGNADGWMPDHPNNYLGKLNLIFLFDILF